MAIDSQDKRAGAQGLHIHPLHPAADGAIGQADRQMVVGVYPRILAGVPVSGFAWRRIFNLAYRSRYKYNTVVRGGR